jgi:hypothetical protein
MRSDGSVIAQAVSRRLFNVTARVHYQSVYVRFVVDNVAPGQDISWYFGLS